MDGDNDDGAAGDSGVDNGDGDGDGNDDDNDCHDECETHSGDEGEHSIEYRGVANGIIIITIII